MDAIQTTPSSISDPSYQKVIISLVQFEQDFNTHTNTSWIRQGEQGSYLRPVQFLDLLTVVKEYTFLYLVRARWVYYHTIKSPPDYQTNDVYQRLGIYTSWPSFTSTRHCQVANKIFALDADADAGLVSANSAISHHS